MIAQLHRMGFKVMLWICPFISADQAMVMRTLMKDKALLMKKTPEKNSWEVASDPAIIKWWNGYSTLLDFTNPAAVTWFHGQLEALQKEFGVDGFKFDAGDMNFYPADALSKVSVTPNRQCELYAQFGLQYPLNEYRACWKMAGQPLVQRLHDKNHTWEDVQKLIPHMLVESLAGYTFSCPDMIGGGNWTSFLDPKTFNQDIVVRSAQVHALMPMMQFSVAPWRILDKAHLEVVKKALALRQKFTPLIMDLARQSAQNNRSIISSMEYRFPGQGYENITDQFILGDNILVAPVVTASNVRKVVLPKGTWKGDDGKTYKGGQTYELEVPLDRLPYFELTK
jgi:alpha-glucosidase